MDLQTFRRIVDRTSALIGPSKDHLEDLYNYVGLDYQSTVQQLSTVNDALYDRIRDAFTAGHAEVWRVCRSLEEDLIREHVILDVSLDPYFEVLGRVRDAVRARSGERGDIAGDWVAAVQAAQDHIEVSSYRMTNHERFFAREFSVARAAKFLKQQNYEIRLAPGIISLEEGAESALVTDIEKLVARLGGLNVAKRIFADVSPSYDADMGRYHIVPAISATGGGVPQVPWGYLLQLAAKHIDGQKPYLNFDTHWPQLVNLATAYVAVIDVQPYSPSAWHGFDAQGLIKFLQEQAVYDSTFRFLQLRNSDVLKLCRGALRFLDPDALTPDGWTLNEAFEVIHYLVESSRNVRGPLTIADAAVRRALPHISKERVSSILGDVLAHPSGGPNQNFSRPTDAPSEADKSRGADLYLKPLIRRAGNQYLIVDGSASGWGYIEALLTALRHHDKHIDDKVGASIEGFLEGELNLRGVPTFSGDYDSNGAHGECDLVVETPQTLVFMELKKKSLTRRARAGSDADLLLDLAGSLLNAQAQAGWHELRISKAGSLALVRAGDVRQISLDNRGIEKFAVSLSDFGSFQDRIMLKHFLEATMNVNFGSPDPTYARRFENINDALAEIREQYNEKHSGDKEVRQPFFNCWFVSVPQLLILLDRVADAESFRSELWKYRHMTTGASDLYFEMSRRRGMEGALASVSTI